MKNSVEPQSKRPATPALLSQASLTLGDTELILTADRIAWWPQTSTLLLADAHFGKAATFRKAGLPVPGGTTAQMLATLSAALHKTVARRLIILGDFIHSSTRAARDFEADLVDWRAQHAALKITLVKGNHDRHCDDLFRRLQLEVHEQELHLGPFLLCHDPLHPKYTRSEEFRLGGHVHPGYRIPGKSMKTLPCFWKANRFLIFPAFGAFTGLSPVKPATDDAIFAICKSEIAKLYPSV